jgi:hypothetical protein
MTKFQERIVSLVRGKAKQYEKGNNKEKTHPDLFAIANELEAYFEGLNFNK